MIFFFNVIPEQCLFVGFVYLFALLAFYAYQRLFFFMAHKKTNATKAIVIQAMGLFRARETGGLLVSLKWVSKSTEFSEVLPLRSEQAKTNSPS